LYEEFETNEHSKLDIMRSLIVYPFLLSPIALSLSSPTVERVGSNRDERHEIFNIDWEKELFGRNSPVPLAERADTSIDAIFKKLGKLYFGTCADSGSLSQTSNAAVIMADFGQVTPENRHIMQATLEGLGS
jgi:endo-1,4-beta-xylanase